MGIILVTGTNRKAHDNLIESLCPIEYNGDGSNCHRLIVFKILIKIYVHMYKSIYIYMQ